MPEIKLQHVVSVTGEDKNYPADNLLKSESFKKWKSGSAGEKQVSVTLQFEKASQIHQIDIGNDGSAFVEVLVGRSAMKDDEYQVILVASSFMNPIESRSSQNLNRVRIFGAEKLSKVTLEHKWDRVKVICTQPFNKSTQYGLAFIKFHSPQSEADKKAEAAETSKKTFGAFSVRPTGDDNIQQGSLFAKRGKDTAQAAPLTGAAAVRAASKLAEESRMDRWSSHTAGVVSECGDHAKGSVSQHTDSQRNSSKQSTKRRRSHGDDWPGNGNEKHSSQRQSHASGPSMASGSTYSSPPPSKKARGEMPIVKKTQSKTVPLDQVMRRVVFVLSGFQYPQRGQLRDKAVQMGARYQGEWNRQCTHLICAFKNTPKYSQVRGKGRIVTKDWILDCHTRKQRLPWRQYRLGSATTPPGSSDEEEEEGEAMEEEEEQREEVPNTSSAQNEPSQHSRKSPKSDDAADTGNRRHSPVVSVDSGEDTEEEIRRLKEAEEKRKNPNNDPYEASTDDDNESSGGELPELPEFFTNKHFFFYGAFMPAERRTLLRYITAYNGMVEDYMRDRVNFVISNSPWDDNFDEALADNPDVIFVRPDWIETCHNSQSLVPYQKYMVVPL